MSIVFYVIFSGLLPVAALYLLGWLMQIPIRRTQRNFYMPPVPPPAEPASRLLTRQQELTQQIIETRNKIEALELEKATARIEYVEIFEKYMQAHLPHKDFFVAEELFTLLESFSLKGAENKYGETYFKYENLHYLEMAPTIFLDRRRENYEFGTKLFDDSEKRIVDVKDLYDEF